jgi:tRNA dimethylallyltransferase
VTNRQARAVLIAGPTASGKSAAALALATRLGGTVINADSMQVYRELAILTARPVAADETIAPHRLYGIVSAREAYSVGRWLEDAASAIAEAKGEGRLPILVGGTGLYFRALLEGLAPVPDIPGDIRAHWRTLGVKRVDDLYQELAARDPAMAARLKPTDTQRVVRALEVIDATGVSLAEWQGGNVSPLLAPENVLKLVVAPEREFIYAAIDARFDRMIALGAVEEARALAALQLDPGLPVMRAHGVRELAAHLAGACSLEEAVAKAKTETRRYAKRQMTWARRFMADWHWIPGIRCQVPGIGPIGDPDT